MSSNIELETRYDPKAVEGEIYAEWEASGAFRAQPDDRPPGKRFVVMIPLPNVTGALHLGHAINNTLQDIQVRYHRMRGDNTLWQPGTDHAGIATQAVVEKRIFATEGKTRHDLGREELVRRIWEWKEQYQTRIVSQLKQMGCSCDWDRMRFTLDEGCAKAVRHTFFRWFKDDLIFRGKRLVNWDTALQTAVSDDEVYHARVKGKLTHIRYPIVDDSNSSQPSRPPQADEGAVSHLVVATTRPETMLGDTAVAVHPDDPRYKHLIGGKCRLPLMDREIPIIGDPILVDMEFGTGCVKVTPAHDQNDNDCGKRNQLDTINIMTPDGRINEEGGRYAGLTFDDASKKVVADLEALDLIEKIEDYEYEVGHSDRSKTRIQKYESDQWFVRMGDLTPEEASKINSGYFKDYIEKARAEARTDEMLPGLAQMAIDAVKSGRVKVFPERYTKTYRDWLNEKRDWCISRQLWWGHRIPVWTRQVFGLDPSQQNIDSHHWADIQFKDWTEAERRAVALQVELIPGALLLHVCVAPGFPEIEAALVREGFVQDPDVLDTWFSSQLWPYSTIGWPDDADSKAKGLDYYYPGSVVITSRDIITLWVARMVLSGLYNMGDVPFEHVYIHTKILDARGETMSKSKGNGVDPVDIIEVYGADALRYSITELATEMQDIRMPVDYRCPHCSALTPQTKVVPRNKQPTEIARARCESCKKEFATQWADDDTKQLLGVARETSDRFEVGRNFCNKVWNAARFAFMNLEGVGCEKLELAQLPVEDRWILAELSRTCRRINDLLVRYQFAAIVKTLRDFFWNSLCDWYIELTKARLAGGSQAAEAKQVLAFALDQTLRLMHPVMPFITERLWKQLNAIAPKRALPGLAEPAMGDLLITAEFPPAEGWSALDNDEILGVFEALQAATAGVRNLRSLCGVSPKERVTVTIKCPAAEVDTLRAQAGIVQHLAGVENLTIDPDAARPKNAASALIGSLQIMVHDISDDDAERARYQKDLLGLQKQIAGKESKLGNEKFVSRADPQIVEAERGRLEELKSRRQTVQDALALLG
ncbi:MAG: valine--tRNA ligase [Planctomycetes bacterium]|nr:valine--tRNA ligase [Planctomycetota bacterium]